MTAKRSALVGSARRCCATGRTDRVARFCDGNGRLYCTPKALWKLRWFLRDFGYDPDLMGRDEVDEKALVGLRGIVRVSETILNGQSFLNLDGLATAADWEELSVSAANSQEVTHDV